MNKKAHAKKEKNTLPGLRGRIWIDGSEGTFLGYGRVVLLEKIGELGSISKAAKVMDMSFRHAWQLIDSMNKQAEAPLVETLAGGKGGGGAKLTREGEKVIEFFWEFYSDFQDFLKQEKFKLRLNRRHLFK